MSDKTDKSEKKQTSKSVLAEIERIRKSNVRKTERIAVLKKEIAADTAKVKELKKLHNVLQQAELQHKIAKEWIKGKKMTDEQIMKLLEVGSQIHDKLDDLDTGAVVNAVVNASKKQGEETKSPPKS